MVVHIHVNADLLYSLCLVRANTEPSVLVAQTASAICSVLASRVHHMETARLATRKHAFLFAAVPASFVIMLVDVDSAPKTNEVELHNSHLKSHELFDKSIGR